MCSGIKNDSNSCGFVCPDDRALYFSKASHINLVSEGFKDYFSKYKQPSYSYYTNGIDDVFLSAGAGKEENESLQKPMIVTYAGNIGSGQGLER